MEDVNCNHNTINREDINKLECHFKWNPQNGDVEADPGRNIDHLFRDIDEFPDIKMLKLEFIGYLYAVDCPPQFTKAIAMFDDIIDCCKKPPIGHDEEYKGYETVAQYNKINIFVLLDKQNEAEKLYKVCSKYEGLHEKSRASMYGCHGYALSLHGRLNYHKSVSMYQNAIDLDPDNYCWHVGLAYVAGKNRRCTEGIQSLPTPYEEQCLQKAIELTSETQYFPLILLAELYFHKCRDFENKGVPKDNQMKEKAKALYEKALDITPDSVHVLKRCGKAFHILGEEDRGLACLLKAIDLNPDCSQTLHRLGQIYEHGKQTKDYKKAEMYYSKAVIAGIRRNFLAETDLARIRKKQDASYDLMKHYEAMKYHYLDDEEKLEFLENNIKRAEEHYKEFLNKSLGSNGNGSGSRVRRGRGGRNRASRGRGGNRLKLNADINYDSVCRKTERGRIREPRVGERGIRRRGGRASMNHIQNKSYSMLARENEEVQKENAKETLNVEENDKQCK